MRVNIQLFADGTDANKTTQSSMSAQMKEFYDTELLENSRKDMFFGQFGEKQPLPAGGGNKVEWRKWNTFDKALTPLTEGVTPTGQTFGSTKIETECYQHGTYTKITDKLELQAIDDVILGAAEEMGASAGETQDTLIRNRVIAGTNVYYAPDGNTEVTSRKDLNKNCVLTPTLINKVATKLKKAKAPKIDGSYIMMIHPSCSFDIRESDGWKDVHKYSAVKEIFNGEIGELHGVRFIENDNVKVIAPAVISDSLNKLTVKTVEGIRASLGLNEKLVAVARVLIKNRRNLCHVRLGCLINPVCGDKLSAVPFTVLQVALSDFCYILNRHECSPSACVAAVVILFPKRNVDSERLEQSRRKIFRNRLPGKLCKKL